MKIKNLLCSAAFAAFVVPSLQAAPPVNDNFVNATVLAGVTGTSSGINVEATLESGESTYGQHSVWYAWVAPATGVVVFDTLVTDFDSKLLIATGASVSTLINLATNDDSGGGAGSLVQANVTSGVTYYIGALGYSSGDVGSFTLNWSLAIPPANDNFANATVISGATGAASASTALATQQTDEYWGYSKSVWYRWTAPASGKYVFDTRGAARPTLIYVFTGTAITELVSVDLSSSYSSLSEHLVKVDVSAGTTYQIQISTYSSNATSFDLKWRAISTPINDAFHAAAAITGETGTVSADTFEAGLQPFEPAWYEDEHSLWYSWVAPFTGVVTFDTFGSATGTTLMVTDSSALDSLNIIAENGLSELSEVFEEDHSRVMLPVVSGSTYRVRVATYNEGDIKLNWARDTVNVPAVISIGSSSFEAAEGGPAVNVTLTRNPGSASDADNCYVYTENGSADETDFVATYTLVSFDSGDTSASVSIPIRQDRRFEGEETFLVRLIMPSEGTAFGLSTATVNIADDEPFIPLKANYTGLSQVFPFDQSLTGTLKINATGNGSFSGSLQLGSSSASPFSGSFDSAGKATVTVVRKTSGNALLNLTYSDNGNRIRALVSVAGKTVAVQAWRIIYGKDVEISPKPLVFTARINRPLSAIGDVPKADCFLSVTVSVKGLVKVVGILADGTSFTSSGPIAGYDIFPLYAALYKGKGSVSSELFIDDGDSDDSEYEDEETYLTWFKAVSLTDKSFKNGFTQTMSVDISPYVFSKKTPFIRNVKYTNGAADFLAFGPALPEQRLSQVFRLLENNSIALPLSPQVKLTFKFAPATGFFSGTFQQGTASAITFKGAVLQRAYYNDGDFDYYDEASGFFLAPLLGGSVISSGTVEIVAVE